METCKGWRISSPIMERFISIFDNFYNSPEQFCIFHRTENVLYKGHRMLNTVPGEFEEFNFRKLIQKNDRQMKT